MTIRNVKNIAQAQPGQSQVSNALNMASGRVQLVDGAQQEDLTSVGNIPATRVVTGGYVGVPPLADTGQLTFSYDSLTKILTVASSNALDVNVVDWVIFW